MATEFSLAVLINMRAADRGAALRRYFAHHRLPDEEVAELLAALGSAPPLKLERAIASVLRLVVERLMTAAAAASPENVARIDQCSHG
jgi:hypothetical protein